MITIPSHTTHIHSPLLRYFPQSPIVTSFWFFLPKERRRGVYIGQDKWERNNKNENNQSKPFPPPSVSWRMNSSTKSFATTSRRFERLTDHHQGRAATIAWFFVGGLEERHQEHEFEGSYGFRKTSIAWLGLDSTEELKSSSVLHSVFLF